MGSSVSLKPQVNIAPTAIQQAITTNSKSELNRVEDDANNNRITDIAAMTEKMKLESQINDVKVTPVKYVEEIKPKAAQLNPTEQVSAAIAPKTVTDVIKRMHNGKQLSSYEQSQMLTGQMNQMAINNRVLHGLF